MDWRKISVLFLFTLVVCACNKETQNDVPTPTDPNAGTQTPITVTPDASNGALPSLTTAELIRDYPPFLADLREMYGAPQTEDVVIAYGDMSLTKGSELSGKGTFLIETDIAAYFFSIPLFTGTWDGTNLDVIFADDSGLIRIKGAISGSLVNAKIFSRIRLSASEPICRAYVQSPCGSQASCIVKDVAKCKADMAEGATGVKQVGRIEKPVSEIGEWIK